MAADSAMKTLDGIATDSSFQLVKEISNDLAKDVGDAKKPSDASASTVSQATVGAKAAPTVDGGESTMTKVDLKAKASSNTAQGGVSTIATDMTEAAPENPSSKEKPVNTTGIQTTPQTTNDTVIDQKSAAATTLDAGSHLVVAAAVTVTNKQPTSTATPTLTPVPPPAAVQPPVVLPRQKSATTSDMTPLSASSNALSDHDPTISAGSTKEASVTDLHQSMRFPNIEIVKLSY
jgi:hypothetical protein